MPYSHELDLLFQPLSVMALTPNIVATRNSSLFILFYLWKTSFFSSQTDLSVEDIFDKYNQDINLYTLARLAFLEALSFDWHKDAHFLFLTTMKLPLYVY